MLNPLSRFSAEPLWGKALPKSGPARLPEPGSGDEVSLSGLGPLFSGPSANSALPEVAQAPSSGQISEVGSAPTPPRDDSARTPGPLLTSVQDGIGRVATPTRWGALLMEEGGISRATPGATQAFSQHVTTGLQQKVQEVVIVGGGPGGLATAIELAERGIKVKVVEVRDSDYKRPHHLNARMSTLESFQDYGIYDEIQQASGIDENIKPLRGRGLTNGRHVINSESVAQVRISDVEKALYNRAAELGVEYLPHHRVEVGEMDENGLHSVRVEKVEIVDGSVRGTGAFSSAWKPDMVVVADGAGSPTRNSLGIKFLEESEGKTYLGGLVHKSLGPDGGYNKLATLEGSELRHFMATGHKKYPQTWVSVEADSSVAQLTPEQRTQYLAERASLVMNQSIRPEDIGWGAGQITVVQNRRAEVTTSGNNLVMIGDAIRTGSVWQSGGLNLALTTDIENVVRLVDNVNHRDHSREHALHEYNLRAQAATRAWHEAGKKELNAH